MNVLRHASYQLSWDHELGWVYKGMGEEKPISNLAHLTTAPFELGGIISSIRHKYIGTIDSEEKKATASYLESIADTSTVMDELMFKAAKTQETSDPLINTIQD